MPDPATEEAPYRVSSKAPAGLRLEAGTDGPPTVHYTADDGETAAVCSLEEAMERGWVDTAPVHRKRAAKKAAPEPEVVGAAIYPAMVAILRDLPAIGKNARNQQQGFAFRSVDEVIDHLNPILAKHGVFFLPTVEDRVAEARTTKGGTTLWTVHLRVRFTFVGPDGTTVEAVTWGEGTDMCDKATSKAHTMAMKSMLMEVFAISDHELDPDATTPEGSNADTQPQPPADSMTKESRDEIKEQIAALSPEQRGLLKSLWNGASIPPIDHLMLRESHAEGIWTLISQAAAVPEASSP